MYRSNNKYQFLPVSDSGGAGMRCSVYTTQPLLQSPMSKCNVNLSKIRYIMHILSNVMSHVFT